MTDKNFNEQRIKDLEKRLKDKIEGLDFAKDEEHYQWLLHDIAQKEWKINYWKKIKNNNI